MTTRPLALRSTIDGRTSVLPLPADFDWTTCAAMLVVLFAESENRLERFWSVAGIYGPDVAAETFTIATGKPEHAALLRDAFLAGEREDAEAYERDVLEEPKRRAARAREVAAESAAREADLRSKGLRTCPRCGGAGGADKWAHTGRVCFECNGKGHVPARRR